MAEFADRDKGRAEIARLMGKLNAKQKRELIDLMGEPPDLRNVPQSFWDRCQVEIENELAIAILVLFMESAVLHELDEVTAETLAGQWAPVRASESAASIVTTTRKIVANAVNESTSAPVHPQTHAETAIERIETIREAIDSAYSPERAANIARNEANVAMVEGGEQAIEATGVQVERYWRHTAHPAPRHAGAEVKPCKLCTPLLNTSGDSWGGHRPGYRHPSCDCFIEYVEIHTRRTIGVQPEEPATARS